MARLRAMMVEPPDTAAALEQIVAYGREAAAKETDALVNRGAALLARAEADAGEDASWQSHLDAGRRQLADLNAKYEAAKNAEAEARRAYLAAHGAAGDSAKARVWFCRGWRTHGGRTCRRKTARHAEVPRA